MPSYRVICHHGIKGQRWGKRNGPPYPLDEEDKSAKEKSEERKSVNWKKVGTAAAITAGAALAVYGGYKLSKLSSIKHIGKDRIDHILGSDGEVKPSIHTIPEVESLAKSVNPLKGRHNCVATSAALCGQMSGQKVTAKGDIFGPNTGYPLKEVVACFNRELEDPFHGTSFESANKSAYNHLMTTLLDKPDGSYGLLSTAKRQRDPISNKVLKDENGKEKYLGHEIVWFVVSGRVHLIESQRDVYNSVTDSSESRLLDNNDWFEKKFKGSGLEHCLIADLTGAKIDEEKGKKYFDFA